MENATCPTSPGEVCRTIELWRSLVDEVMKLLVLGTCI